MNKSCSKSHAYTYIKYFSLAHIQVDFFVLIYKYLVERYAESCEKLCKLLNKNILKYCLDINSVHNEIERIIHFIIYLAQTVLFILQVHSIHSL